jgi:sialate O-acetylesterase
MIKLSPLFSDGMVLQRNADIKISGLSAPGDIVGITFRGERFTAEADEGGAWACRTGKFPETAEPCEMTVVSKEGEVVIRDVLVGDVWLCSGQSNMELTLDRVRHNYPRELTATDPLIRQLKVPQVYNFDAPVAERGLSDCAWESFNPATAPGFTAAGYFFAKNLRGRYKIPIGLFACAVGGTPVAAWMSRDMLESLNLSGDLDEAVECQSPGYVEKILSDYDLYERDYHKRLNEADEGLRQGFMNAKYDCSGWEEVSLCAPVEKSGSYWYRKTVEIPESLSGKEAAIFLGTAVDMDEVFINGGKIGATHYRYPPREYKFVLPEGKMTIAVRLLCFNGSGGFTAGKNYFIAAETKTINVGGAWKRRLGAPFEPKKPQTFFAYKPTGLFNGMISPLSNYAVKGVIWYQGESDAGEPSRYGEKLTAVIKGWRELWGIEDMPFLITQPAYYGYTGNADWEILRERQKLCLSLPNTGLAAAYDLGEHNDLHPQNKRDIGERLARLASRVAYGERLPPNMFEMYNLLK